MASKQEKLNNLHSQSLINRAGARRIAFFGLCIWDHKLASIDEIRDFDWYRRIVEEDDEQGLLPQIAVDAGARTLDFSRELFLGTVNNIEKIDKAIRKYLVNWDFERLRPVDRAILRLSVYSLIYRYDIPSEVSIFEANELADDYSEEDSYKYINGILHSIKMEYRRNFILEPRRLVKKKIVKIKGK